MRWRGGGAGGVAAGEALQVAQAQGAGFVVVAGEGFGVFDELLVGHGSLADALFEQCSCWSVGQPGHHLGEAWV